MKVDADIDVRFRRQLVVGSYVYTDALGREEMATEIVVANGSDFGPIQDIADKMHEVAEKAGGKVKHALVTLVPPQTISRLHDRDA